MTEEQIEQKAEQKYKEHLADPNYYENSEEESFYTGYVEGYLECQKEHEWHYVKDGDLPKENELVLIKITGCFVLGWTNGTNWFNDSNNGTIIDRRMVIAWKEIVFQRRVNRNDRRKETRLNEKI